MGRNAPGPRTFSWALYDFANTIFSMNVITLYFALWVTVDRHGTDTHYAVALSTATAIALLGMPVLGVVSDRVHRRMPFLVGSTLACVAATATIGLISSLWAGLALFTLAYVCYQVSLVFYDALLPEVAGSHERVGRVSGYGVALGYLGAIVGLALVKPFVDLWGRSAAFVPTALLFLLFALPCFLWVRDVDPRPVDWKTVLRDAGPATRRVWQTIREARLYRPMFLFLTANFLFSDAANTIINFVAIYAHAVVGLSNAAIVRFLMVSTSFAVVGSWAWGKVTDHIGPKRTMMAILLGWCGTLLVTMLSQSAGTFNLVGPLAGICLGGTWVTGRTLVVRLSPPDKLGEFFGLYGLTEKFTAVLGPLLWALVVDGVFRSWGVARYRIAVGTLLLSVVAGMVIMSQVRLGEAPPRTAD